MKIPPMKVKNWVMNGWSTPSVARIWSMRSGVQVLPQIITAGSGDSAKKIQ